MITYLSLIGVMVSVHELEFGKHIGTLGNIILIQDNYSLILLH
jgi:hypothetical protein